ncbi:MAG: neocarzinostatin apoprotein domain-containing protein, partial [Acidimicrobiia bacterium]|nr:neocarzinostatin apoprotein domain-containing protein [Acidimicrobiia bacterium]
AAAPSMTVTPNSGVIDGQTVIVRGAGYTPNLAVGTTLCSSAVIPSENPLECDQQFIATSTAAPDGTAEIALTARRFNVVRGQPMPNQGAWGRSPDPRRRPGIRSAVTVHAINGDWSAYRGPWQQQGAWRTTAG